MSVAILAATYTGTYFQYPKFNCGDIEFLVGFTYLGDMVSLNFVCQDIVGVSILSQSNTVFKRKIQLELRRAHTPRAHCAIYRFNCTGLRGAWL